MITFYQDHFQQREIFSPSSKQIHFQIGATMCKVTNDDKPLSFEK